MKIDFVSKDSKESVSLNPNETTQIVGSWVSLCGKFSLELNLVIVIVVVSHKFCSTQPTSRDGTGAVPYSYVQRDDVSNNPMQFPD